jgi:hypothetical protein
MFRFVLIYLFITTVVRRKSQFFLPFPNSFLVHSPNVLIPNSFFGFPSNVFCSPERDLDRAVWFIWFISSNILLFIQCDSEHEEAKDDTTLVFELKVKCTRNKNAPKDATDPDELYINSKGKIMYSNR